MNIKLEEFNECPGGRVAEYILLDLRTNDAMMVEDLPEEDYWQNKYDTLVVSIKLNSKRVELTNAFRRIITIIGRFRPDEVHEHAKENKLFFRLWWD